MELDISKIYRVLKGGGSHQLKSVQPTFDIRHQVNQSSDSPDKPVLGLSRVEVSTPQNLFRGQGPMMAEEAPAEI